MNRKARLTWLGLFVQRFLAACFLLQAPGQAEGFEAAVVGFLDVVGETACGQLLHTQMIAYALAAYSLSGTARI